MAEGFDAKAGARGTRGLVAPELLEALDAFPPIVLSEEILPLARAGLGAAAPPLTAEQESVRREERFIPGPAGAPDVRVLIYTPPGQASARPAYLHVHGGGYVLGSPEINDAANRDTAREQGCVVVSVDYRLAPETRFPGALEDCYAALTWLASNAGELGVDRNRIAIGGESAGGGHAAALALLARDRGEVPIRLQVLDAPMLDDRTGASTEPHAFCGEFVWTAELNRFGWQALLGCEPASPDVQANAAPARAADLAGLPPTLITVGSLDLFLEEDLEYARRLARAGVPVELHIIPGGFHGFARAGLAAPQVQALRRHQGEALKRAFAER
jgi:triacylglycerol lipase